MVFTCRDLTNVQEIKMISATSTYGLGLLTSIAFYFCSLLGIECNLYNKKVERAKSIATQALLAKAQDLKADGVMCVQFQLHATTIFVYGIAYKQA